MLFRLILPMVIIREQRQPDNMKMDKRIVRKRITSRENVNETINDRSRRLTERLKRTGVLDTEDKRKSKGKIKKARTTGTHVIGKEKPGYHFECGDDDNTHSLADDESVNDALMQGKQLGEDMCDARHDNDIKHMTITHEKKDEVSLLSGQTRSTFVSLENSVFDDMSNVVKSSWKEQKKAMSKIFGPCVRDEFVKDYKFCNEKICRHIVTKCLARNEIVQTPGLSYDQFVDVTAKSTRVSNFFNSQRHHIQSKMRSVYIGEKLMVSGQLVAINDLLTIVHLLPSYIQLPGNREKGGLVPEEFPGVLKINTTNKDEPLLHEHYGKFGVDGMPEFEYFIKTLLSEVQPKRTRYKRQRGHEIISACFTASDEAFALIVLDNELHVWDQQIEKRKGSRCKKSDLRMEKKYMKRHGSGGKCGWSKEGQKIYKRLTDEIVAQRKEGWRELDERKYRDKFRQEMGLQPASTTMRSSANTEQGGKDSDSEIEFGGEDSFEDFRPSNLKSL